MVAFNLPADTSAVIPVIYFDEGSAAMEPAAAHWTIKSSAAAVKCGLSEDGHTARITPAGKPGDSARVVLERGPVHATLDVTITEARL